MTTVFDFVEKGQTALAEAAISSQFATVLLLVCLGWMIYHAASGLLSRQSLSANVVISALVAYVVYSGWSEQLRHEGALQDQYSKLIALRNSGQLHVAVGIVSVLHTQPTTGHTDGDIIRIDVVEFEFSCWGGDPFAYQRTIAFGGVLTEGTFARVYHFQADASSSGRQILRIDLQEAHVSSAKVDQLLPCGAG